MTVVTGKPIDPPSVLHRDCVACLADHVSGCTPAEATIAVLKTLQSVSLGQVVKDLCNAHLGLLSGQKGSSRT